MADCAPAIRIERLLKPDMVRIREIDRSEAIRIGYRVENGELMEFPVRWDDNGWREGEGPHTFSEMIRGAEELFDCDAIAFGAIADERLVGIAIYRPRLTPEMGQLALLHVSNQYRRQGVASRLFEEVLSCARADEATHLYVSATPSGSAIGFYQSRGFALTPTPDPTLLALEPDDIHMVMQL